MTINIDDLKKYLLNVDVDPFIKSMQNAINECPQGGNDTTAYWASMYKDQRYTPHNYYKNAIEDCLLHRLALFTLKGSPVLNSSGYFEFLTDSAKEIYHSAKIYQHLIKLKKLKNIED